METDGWLVNCKVIVEYVTSYALLPFVVLSVISPASSRFVVKTCFTLLLVSADCELCASIITAKKRRKKPDQERIDLDSRNY
jgi:hypothetical protein